MVPLPIALTPEAQADLAEAAVGRHDWIGGAGRPDRSVIRGDYRARDQRWDGKNEAALAAELSKAVSALAAEIAAALPKK